MEFCQMVIVSTVGINEYAIKRYIEHQWQETVGQAPREAFTLYYHKDDLYLSI